LASLVGELADGARVLGWSEGVHLRAEYLRARNAVVRHLVERHGLRVLAAETHFALSRAADAHIRGLGPDDPGPAAVRGVWSWSRAPLADNLALLRGLRRHNAGLPPDEQVRFYGLEMYGGPADGIAPDGRAFDDPDDLRHAARLRRRLAEHRAAGGDHRDTAVRDAAQYLTLQEVARRHADGTILLFEQVEHLDPRVPGSLGARLAQGGLGHYRAVGAVWHDGDPTVRYPLGRYRDLSRRLQEHVDARTPVPLAAPAGTVVVDLRPYAAPASPSPDSPDAPLGDAATAFHAVLHAPVLTPAHPTGSSPADGAGGSAAAPA
jgi:hypothetical protein